MSLSVNDVIHWFRDLPWANDVDVQFLERYRQQVWKRDQGGDVPSRGALAYYHREMFGAIVERFNNIGRLPAGPPEQFAAETVQAFEIGLQRAITTYRTFQEPGPEDVVDPPVDPGGPPSQGSPFGNRWTTAGVDFLQDGRRVKYLAVTAFTLYQDWLEGRDRTTYLRFMKQFGFNFVRVFGMWGVNNPLGIFDPRRYGDLYYARFPEFCRWLASEGYGLHFVTWTDQVDGSGVVYSDGTQAHHARMLELQAAQPNAIAEDINEAFKNGGLVFDAGTPVGLLRTRSTWEDGKTPDSVGVPLLQYTSEHTPRDGQASRKAKNLFETSRAGLGSWGPSRIPAIAGEPPRLEDLSLSGVESYFSIAIGMGSGACAHSLGFRICEIPTDQGLLDRLATLHSVILDPPGFEFHSAGQYTRGGPDGGPCPLEHRDRFGDNNDSDEEVDPRGSRRTYALSLGDHAIGMVDNPGAAWSPVGANGWTVVRRHHTAYGLTVDLQR